MNFFKIAKKFHDDEEGAVTVDWVVLTAAVVGLGAAGLTVVKNGVTSLASEISSTLDSVSVVTAS
ncbi:MAG: hypothetical protein WBA91_05265 [Paracoccaceae bacterium]